MLEIAVLGLLKEQPLHGYELKKRLSETLGFLWGVSYGSLYPALRRLEREGAIEVVAEPVALAPPIAATGSLKGDLAAARLGAGRTPKPSRRTRKAYRITPAGVARFVELLLADDPHTDEDKAFALKLAFCSELPAPARIELLERRRIALLTRLNQSRRATATRNDRYSRSLVEHRLRSIQRDLEWIEELLEAERATEVTDIPDPGLPDVKEGVSR
jgi:DNA-binding PadR family transcriptional regulator